MPMPSAYETRSEAFFRLYEGETPQEIQTLLTRWIPKGSRVLELGCGSGRDARFMSGLDAIVEATDKTWQLMKLTVSMLGKLITGDVKLNNLSGPISIAKGAGMTAELGVVYYLPFLALISVNLGIINLFPLPVLDGGHLLFLAIEKIKGGPVSERVQDFCYRIGSILLVLLMGLALFNDFSRL